MKSTGGVEDVGDMIEDADVAAGKKIASRKEHPFARWTGAISEVGDQGPLYAIGSAIVVTGWLRKDVRCLSAGVAALAAVASADLLKNTVKRLVKRSRPEQTLEHGEYRFEKGGSERREEQSFPSGHVACTIAAVETMSRFYPAMTPVLRPVAAVMALGRVAKGKHWPSDLIAGLAIGLFSAWLARRVLPGRD